MYQPTRYIVVKIPTRARNGDLRDGLRTRGECMVRAAWAQFRKPTGSVLWVSGNLKYAVDKYFNEISQLYSPEVQKGKVFTPQHDCYFRAFGEVQKLKLVTA